MPGSATPSRLSIRAGTEADIDLIHRFVTLLAVYERLAHEVVATPEVLRAELFGPRPSAEVLFAHLGEEPVGFALFFHNFSTFMGRKGLYLEDLYVLEEHRGKGIGKALLQRLASIAVERQCRRFEWAVLDWNESAIRFYRSLGAEAQDEWTVFRLSGDGLHALASAGRS